MVFPRSVVKRILDGRSRIIVAMETARVPRSLEAFGRNAAEYFMLAVDNPQTSQGEAFNGTEDTMPTTVQWVLMVRFELYFQLYFPPENGAF